MFLQQVVEKQLEAFDCAQPIGFTMSLITEKSLTSLVKALEIAGLNTKQPFSVKLSGSTT